MNIPNNFMTMFQQYMQNPRQALSAFFHLPQNATTPDQIIQHLLNTGQVTQDQVNNAMQMRNNPFIQQLLNNRR